MAIAHYQFECTHPLSDGNGRTGRIMNILHLIQNEFLSPPILYLSRFILDRCSDYYTLLSRVTLGIMDIIYAGCRRKDVPMDD